MVAARLGGVAAPSTKPEVRCDPPRTRGALQHNAPRVPDESHELTRSRTPFRRVENLVQVRDWFQHYLVARRTGLPPLPKSRAGK